MATKIVFESERLSFRPFILDDAQHLYQLNTDPEVIRYTGDPPFGTIEEARSFIENYRHYASEGFGRWAVIRKSDQAFLGWSGLKKNEQELIDLGYRYYQEFWGRGYATEAASACIDYGFQILKIQRIIGRVDPKNLASIKVLEKLGFTFWKRDTCKGIEGALYYEILK